MNILYNYNVQNDWN